MPPGGGCGIMGRHEPHRRRREPSYGKSIPTPPGAQAFELWMQAPMPMVTLLKTLDVTALVRRNRKQGLKFNMLLCWCIG